MLCHKIKMKERTNIEFGFENRKKCKQSIYSVKKICNNDKCLSGTHVFERLETFRRDG